MTINQSSHSRDIFIRRLAQSLRATMTAEQGIMAAHSPIMVGPSSYARRSGVEMGEAIVTAIPCQPNAIEVVVG